MFFWRSRYSKSINVDKINTPPNIIFDKPDKEKVSKDSTDILPKYISNMVWMKRGLFGISLESQNFLIGLIQSVSIFMYFEVFIYFCVFALKS